MMNHCFQTVLLAAEFPDTLPGIQYFLQGFDTDGWLWLFRAIFAGGFVLALILYAHYRKKQTGTNPDREAR